MNRFLGKDKGYIKTLRKVGYQFVGHVKIVAPIEQVQGNVIMDEEERNRIMETEMGKEGDVDWTKEEAEAWDRFMEEKERAECYDEDIKDDKDDMGI